jgi:hypothetical protein
VWRVAERARCLVGLWLSLLVATAHAADDAPFTLTPPPGLRAAPVARAASGNTYAWLPANLKQPLRLMITTMPSGEIRHRLGALSDSQCIRLFLDEIRREHQQFFAVDMGTPLAVGASELRRVRWTGNRNGRTLTGVLSCGEMHGYYYVVHYTDAIEHATESFPAIRASLKSLRTSAR